MTAAAAATVFTVMFALGLAIDVRDLRWAWTRPWLVARRLLSVLVLVPIVGVAVAHALGLSLAAQVGVALMAISPGAPVALRRSLDAGSLSRLPRSCRSSSRCWRSCRCPSPSRH